jgi:hypothetical protein
MKCLYYVAPGLASAHRISDDLHEVGINDFFLHVLAKDESGLVKRQIHAGNYLERLDVLREGFMGAMLGFGAGLVGALLLGYYGPFEDVPGIVYVALAGVATLFGAWAGGLVGIENENKKLARFHDDLEAGKYVVLIYARKEQEAAVVEMMRARHPEAELAAVDSHFINPFSSVQRLTPKARAQASIPQQD